MPKLKLSDRQIKEEAKAKRRQVKRRYRQKAFFSPEKKPWEKMPSAKFFQKI